MGTISFRVSKAERAMRDIAEGRNLVYYKEDLSPSVARKLEAEGLIGTGAFMGILPPNGRDDG